MIKINKNPRGVSAFLNKRFYLHFISRTNRSQAQEVIKAFGGQIEEFLEKGTTSYLLTDIPSEQWPPNGQDPTLHMSLKHGVKLMSFQHLIVYCRDYLISHSSSDDDDELRSRTNELKQPFIKFEDTRRKYAPAVKELNEWPEINLDAPLIPGQTIFGINTANSQTPTPRPSQTPQPKTPQPSNGNMNLHPRTRLFAQHLNTPRHKKQLMESSPTMNPNHWQVFKKSSIHCELCGIRITDKLEEHLNSTEHNANIENARWEDVESVIDSLPNLDSLTTCKRVQLTNLDEQQEFLCLHKVESISQIFLNSSK